MNDVQLIDVVRQGSRSTLWKGRFKDDQLVAVKVFSNTESCDRNFTNECMVYFIMNRHHHQPSLPKFFGCHLLSNSNCLTIEYGHHGSLQSYLSHNTFDWLRMCRLIETLVNGLAFLHTELCHQNQQLKPSIAHRDLCSANIIVKADETCMISDFEFSICFIENVDLEKDFNNINNHSESSLRYLAPEILDADSELLRFRPCESSLKQVDIYALGLILWEISSRCHDLYQGIEVPDYKLPFEREIGPGLPSFDQMRVFVCRHKARPLFPNIWKDSNPAIRLLRETISECWDHEPEARLTALCVAERTTQLMSLWNRYKLKNSSCSINSLQERLRNITNIVECNKSHCDQNYSHHYSHSSYMLSSKSLNHHPNHNYSHRRYPILKVLNDSCLKSSKVKNKLLPTNNTIGHQYSSTNSVCFINKFENSLHYFCDDDHHDCHLKNHQQINKHHHHHHHYHQIKSNFDRHQSSSQQLNRFHQNSSSLDIKNLILLNKKQDLNFLNEQKSKRKNQILTMLYPLQPYQAANPCQERNLLMMDDENENNENRLLNVENYYDRMMMIDENVKEQNLLAALIKNYSKFNNENSANMNLIHSRGSFKNLKYQKHQTVFDEFLIRSSTEHPSSESSPNFAMDSFYDEQSSTSSSTQSQQQQRLINSPSPPNPISYVQNLGYGGDNSNDDNDTRRNQTIKTKDINKYRNHSNDTETISFFKLNLFEYLKRKFQPSKDFSLFTKNEALLSLLKPKNKSNGSMSYKKMATESTEKYQDTSYRMMNEMLIGDLSNLISSKTLLTNHGEIYCFEKVSSLNNNNNNNENETEQEPDKKQNDDETLVKLRSGDCGDLSLDVATNAAISPP